MNPHRRTAFRRAYSSMPSELRCPPAEEQELLEFEARFGTIPLEYRWFLAECGGGVVGSERIDCIRELKRTHERFAEEREAGFWDLLGNVFIIGTDGFGNYFGIDCDSGKIVTQDHDFGGLHVMFGSLEEFLTVGLLGEPTSSWSE